MWRSSAWTSALAAMAAVTYLGCGGDGTTDPPQEDPRPTRAVVASGDGQTGPVDVELPAALIVQINDQSGNGMSGANVTFTVTAGGGSVSSVSGTTDAAGLASTNWTLGTVAGANQQVTAAVVGATNVSVVFSATAVAGDPYLLSMVAGDDQYAFTGTDVPEPLRVKVRDRYANDVSGEIVTFTIPTDRGSVDSSSAFTNNVGEAVSGWTVGMIVGEDTAVAAVEGLQGSPVVFTVTVHNLRITSISPSTLELGGPATIAGSGFDLTPANNTVKVGDLTARVNSATETQLEVSIPDACRPVGPVNVSVKVGDIPSAPVAADLTPSTFLTLAVGEQEIIQDPTSFCLQFDASGAAESYLIGVQSTSEVLSSLTPITVSSVVASGSLAPPALLTSLLAAPVGGSRFAVNRNRMERLTRHRAVEARIREFDRLNFDNVRPNMAATQLASSLRAPAVDSTVAIDDTIEVRVTNGEESCNSYDSITTVVRAVGQKGIWLEDIANPAGGYTASDFQLLSQRFDDVIYSADVAQFGEPSDEDKNGRIVMVITKEVNERGSLGFTTSCDFGTRSSSNLGSNEGEYFYGEAPDPAGDYGDEVSLEDALGWSPAIAAHELVHVIQISGRRAVGGSFPSTWITEGQATLGEEIVGHAMENRSTGENLGLGVAVNWDDTTSFDWYSGAIVDMALYFGWAPTDASVHIHLDEAPQECTWLDNNNGGPCFEGREAYGVPWSLLRWISDQFGPSYAGGEAGFHRDIVSSTGNGYALLEELIGQPIEVLLAQWAATLYVDDRLNGANSALEMTSWNLYDIFYGYYALPDGNYGLIEELRLLPKTTVFTAFKNTANVRAGSTYYTLLTGSGRRGTAIWVGDASEEQLPSHMQVWVVRMQ